MKKEAKKSKVIISLKIGLGLLLAFLGSCQNQVKMLNPDIAGEYESTLDYQLFTDPPAHYRSFPFYSINDRLDTTEIKRQIAGFKEAGFGGFYLHSRDGLLTEFLSEDWWQIMNAAVEAGNQHGLQTMFYDEDKWPSGYAGGIIPKMKEAYRAKSLARLEKSTPLPAGSVVLREDEKYRYIEHTAQMGNAKFNGTCYVDLMNPEMVKAFLQVSHKPYIEKYKSKIQGYVPGFFTDEPHIHARYFDPKTPHKGLYSYSPYVRKKFKALFGYDFIDKVDLLFEEKDNWRQVRLQYHQAVALQFEESFSKQIASFCEQNGFLFTGHYLAEDVLEKVRDRAGNTMLHYRNLHQPGIDILGLGFEDKLITARALSSVANQCDQPRRLSELFGISGQNMNFEDRKWLAGWHAITGVNHFCPHLTLYSMKGLRKRDYPPTFSYHQPYWAYNKMIEDYLGRISYAATIGKYAPQILVINPLESEFLKSNSEGEFTQQTLEVLEALQQAHFDYDLGDEQIMSEIAKIENKRVKIGSMHYEAVVLPDMLGIRSSTLKLLLKFSAKGGKILYTGRFPVFVDGLELHQDIERLKEKSIYLEPGQIRENLKDIISPNVTVENDQGKIWTQVRQTQEGHLVLLCNTSRNEIAHIVTSSPLFDGSIVLWDPTAVACYELKPDAEGKFSFTIAPSSLLWISTGALSQKAQNIQPYPAETLTETLFALDGAWKGKRLSPNSLTIDFASYSTDGKNFSKPEPIIGIFNRLSDQKYSGMLLLNYTFETEQLPSNIRLSVEQPGMYKSITVNQQGIEFEKEAYFVDRLFPSADISGLVRKGLNEIEMELDFKPAINHSEIASERYGSEIESIYLYGDFGVKGQQAVVTMNSQRNRSGDFVPRPVHGFSSFKISTEDSVFDADLTAKGYPFYSGKFMLTKEFTIGDLEPKMDYFIEFPNFEATVLEVSLNGKLIDTLCCSPYQINISEQLNPGLNHLSIVLVSSLRNLMGPHHNQSAEMIRVGPANFTGAGGFPDGAGNSNWYDLRISNPSLRTWTDTYWHIPFGLLEAPVISKKAKK